MTMASCLLTAAFVLAVVTFGPSQGTEILTFIRAPTDVEVAAGSKVELPCRISDKKKTSVRWFRGSTYKELSVGRRIRQTELGDLIIENVQFLDAGLYTCVASRDGESPIRARARLAVRPRTAVKVRPSTLETIAGRPASFICETNVKFDTNSSEVNVTWVRDGVELNEESSGGKYVIESDPPTLEIPVTNEQDSGIYTCKVSTPLDVGSGSANLIVQSVPEEPKIQYVRCSGRQATVRWVHSAASGTAVTTYKIQMNSSFTPESWILVKEVPGGMLSTQVPLTPWGNYSFRIIAENKVGESFPSEPSGRACSSPPDFPSVVPGNVTIGGDRPGELLIKWTPVPEAQHHGPNFSYVISYKLSKPGAEWDDIQVPDWRQDSVRLTDQPIYQKYSIRVGMRNSVGISSMAPQILTGFSGQGVPNGSPDGFCPNGVATVNPDGSVTFSWEPFKAEDVNGFFVGYKMKIRSAEHPVLGAVDLSLDANVTEVVIDDVLIALPYEDLTATLHVINDKYEGGPSEVCRILVPGNLLKHETTEADASPSTNAAENSSSSATSTTAMAMTSSTTQMTTTLPTTLTNRIDLPIAEDNVAEESGSIWSSMANIVSSVAPEPWKVLIEELRKDLAAFRLQLEAKTKEWDSERLYLRQQLNETRTEVQNLGLLSCDSNLSESRWEIVQSELQQLRNEVSALRERLIDVEARRR